MPLESDSGRSRRQILKTGLLVGFGAIGLTAVASEFSGVAQASSGPAAAPGSAAPDITFSTENDWWWCKLCDGLFHSNSSGANAGNCPVSGGNHVKGSNWNYSMVNGNPGVASVQPNWAWCNNCQGLFYGPNQGQSVCPYKGIHHQFGDDIVRSMLYGSWGATPPAEIQGNWHWCHWCQVLFWGTNPPVNSCPSPNSLYHSVGTWNYQLFYVN
jgi:hypothetical protein